jgi:hypothetical protein
MQGHHRSKVRILQVGTTTNRRMRVVPKRDRASHTYSFIRKIRVNSSGITSSSCIEPHGGRQFTYTVVAHKRERLGNDRVM